MKARFITLLFFCAMAAGLHAQTYYTKNGRISFFSKTILENISAVNNQVISVLTIPAGTLQFSVLNTAFHFPKAKMEDDFNEEYMESARYPRSTFKGTIKGIDKIDFARDGTWPVMVSGELMIHGVARNITVPGTLVIQSGNIEAQADFKVLLKDYNIKIPSVVSNKISESIDITIKCLYQKK